MSTNKRIFYAVEQIGIARCGSNTFTSVHGLISAGINTKFSLEQAFEIGQLAIYSNLEGIPDVEITLEKNLDGYPLVYHLATYPSTSATLVGRSNAKATVGLSIYTDTQQSASGTPLAQCTMSGVFVSSINYNFQVQGNSTESVTLVGNNKTWLNAFTASAFVNTDVPFAEIDRRQDFLYSSSRMPQDIPGISGSGTNDFDSVGNQYPAHIQSIKASANLGRDPLYELGHKGAYHRYVNFPVEVKCDIEVLSSTGDSVEALEESNNLVDRTIYFQTREGTKIDLGVHNKLSSVTYGGANAQANGGNATATYSYITFNDMTVSHPQDPSGL